MHFLCGALVVIVLVGLRVTLGQLVVDDPGEGNEQECWLDNQKLDHFDPTNQRTWKQRYYVNEYFVTNRSGPVFLYIGGEGMLSPLYLEGGFLAVLGYQFGALLFALEHRFYGYSWPTPDTSVDNLRYLSSEQALADIAYFIEEMNAKYGLNDNKWVVYGGSYAGALAAWARLRYPHLIHAAVSISGVVLAKETIEFGQFFGHIAAQHSKECAENIHQAAIAYANLLNQPGGSGNLTETFDLCRPIDTKNAGDAAYLTELIIYNIWGQLQVNGEFGLDHICKTMNSGSQNVLARYASLVLEETQGECLVIESIKDQAEEFKDTKFHPRGYFSRQWMYQTCTEFGFYATASSQHGFFGSDLHLSFYVELCKDIFGEKFNLARLTEGVKRTNRLYGGLGINATKVIFTQGSLDPWSVAGVRLSKPDAPAIIIKDTSHCTIMFSPDPTDPVSLTKARKQVKLILRKWLSV